MIGLPKSRGGWLSTTGLAIGGALIVLCILKTMQSWSDKYWPLLAIGFLLVCVSAPPYYYFQSRDKTKDEVRDAGIEALNAAGQSARLKK